MGNLTLNGATSGAITVSPPAVAGTNTLTLPAVTDTVTTNAATQTLTNKTLTTPAINNPTITGTGITFPSATVQTDAAIGYGQTWQNVAGSRVAGTTYTNSTTKPIMVNISLTSTSTGNSASFAVGGVTVWSNSVSTSSGNYATSFSTIVPVGSTYILNNSNNSITAWTELR